MGATERAFGAVVVGVAVGVRSVCWPVLVWWGACWTWPGRDRPGEKRALAAGISNPDGEYGDRVSGQQWTRSKVLRDPIL